MGDGITELPSIIFLAVIHSYGPRDKSSILSVIMASPNLTTEEQTQYNTTEKQGS